MPAKKRSAETPGGVSVKMTKEKETKNTVRFIGPAEGPASKIIVGAVYVTKDALAEIGNLDSIVLNIEAPAK